MTLGPASIFSGIQRGDYLTAIDGETIGPRVNLDSLLDNKVNRRVVLLRIEVRFPSGIVRHLDHAPSPKERRAILFSGESQWPTTTPRP